MSTDDGRTDPGPRALGASRSEWLCVRGLDTHVRRWGRPGGRPLVLLHGARDCAATFRFVVAALRGDWDVAAPDWRGHGHSGRAPGGYWTHDFLADLEALLDGLGLREPVDVVGHSLGGNVATLYAGLRPDRVRRLVSIDGLGPSPRRLPVDVGRMLVGWLDGLAAPDRRGYASLEEVAARLRAANPRLGAERAALLAEVSAECCADGRWRWLFDPAFRHSLPTLHRLEEWAEIWSRITCPVLWIGSSDTQGDAPSCDEATVAARLALLPQADFVRLADTGHNIHHDRPEEVASLVEEFLLR